jgi:hypothetical protein
MIDKLQAHYGFTRMPFGRDLAPGMLHRHAAHNEAVARITWCISDIGNQRYKNLLNAPASRQGYDGAGRPARCLPGGRATCPPFRRLFPGLVPVGVMAVGVGVVRAGSRDGGR